MSYPISEYLIASSHNTYLIDNDSTSQLSGESSSCGYRQALERNCRFLEIDLWDGKTEPIVTHGNTMCSKISSLNVIKSVKSYCQKLSEDGDLNGRKHFYPIILTLENHLSKKFQEMLVKEIKEELVEWLFTRKDLEKFYGKDYGKDFLPIEAESLPSPKDLMDKILIRGGVDPEKYCENLIDITFFHILSFKKTNMAFKMDPENKEIEDEGCEIDIETPKSRISKSQSSKSQKSKDQNVIGTENSEFDPFQTTSVPETCLKLWKFGQNDKQTTLRDWNTNNLNKIYPKAKRVGSSNFNPLPFWNAGYQIVALNYQQSGKFMNLNDGFFQQNNACGYVLKPNLLRNGSRIEQVDVGMKVVQSNSLFRRFSRKSEKDKLLVSQEFKSPIVKFGSTPSSKLTLKPNSKLHSKLPEPSLSVKINSIYWVIDKTGDTARPDILVQLDHYLSSGEIETYKTRLMQGSGFNVDFNSHFFEIKNVSELSVFQISILHNSRRDEFKILGQKSIAYGQIGEKIMGNEVSGDTLVTLLNGFKTIDGGEVPRTTVCLSFKIN